MLLISCAAIVDFSTLLLPNQASTSSFSSTEVALLIVLSGQLPPLVIFQVALLKACPTLYKASIKWPNRARNSLYPSAVNSPSHNSTAWIASCIFPSAAACFPSLPQLVFSFIANYSFPFLCPETEIPVLSHCGCSDQLLQCWLKQRMYNQSVASYKIFNNLSLFTIQPETLLRPPRCPDLWF